MAISSDTSSQEASGQARSEKKCMMCNHSGNNKNIAGSNALENEIEQI